MPGDPTPERKAARVSPGGSEGEPRDYGLPWLLPEQNAQRMREIGRLNGLLQLSDVAPVLKENLVIAADLVSRVELDVQRADELHGALRSSLLPDAQWLELSLLANRHSRDANLNRAELHARLGPLLDSEALSEADRVPVRGLHRRLAAAQQFWRANDTPFECTTRYIETKLPVDRLETKLPVGSEVSVRVRSRIVPGAAFGVHFAKPYPKAGTLEQTLPVRHMHVPDLSLTSLTNAKGRLLYSGMSHGVVPTELSGGALRRLPGRELRTMIEALLLPGIAARTVEVSPTHRDAPRSPRRSPEAQIAKYASQIHRDRDTAEHLAASMRREACRVTGDEILAAALFADLDKLRRALEGQTVELNPLSIVLLTQDDLEQWQGHRPNFLEWGAKTGPEWLKLRGPGGEPCKVPVRLTGNRHQFVVSADEDEDEDEDQQRFTLDTPTARENRKAVEWLLGPGPGEEESGALTAQVASMRARAADLRGELGASTGLRHEQPGASGAVDQRLLIAGHGLDQRTEEAEYLARNARALEHAGHQLQAIRMEESDWPYAIRSGRRVAARIALAAHLMGMLPVVSCMSGAKFAALVDAETKFLATAADNRNGKLPPVEPQAEKWGSARSAFAPR